VSFLHSFKLFPQQSHRNVSFEVYFEKEAEVSDTKKLSNILMEQEAFSGISELVPSKDS